MQSSVAPNSQGIVCTGRGNGKCILVGEHHVLDGATALALGLPAFHTDVTLTLLPATTLSAQLDPTAELPDDVRRDAEKMLEKALEQCGVVGQVTAQVRSTVPIRRGLGSSAALSVAYLRAAEALAGTTKASDSALVQRARQVEGVVHGTSSGLDPAAASGSGAVRFAKGEVLGRVAVSAALAPAQWLLVDLGHSLPTRDAVALAWAARERLPAAQRTALRDRISQATEDAAVALASGDLQQLATALAAAGDTMPALGVVDGEMSALLDCMRKAGALAAKQTGAGLGGMLLGLAADPASAAAIATACGDLAAAVWTMPVAPPD